MVARFAMILMFAGACLAYPVDEEVPYPVEATVGPGQPPFSGLSLSPPPAIGAPVPQGVAPPQGLPSAEGKLESDLKTASSHWYGSHGSHGSHGYHRQSYYPVYYARSYYTQPSSYYYYSYPTHSHQSHHNWNSYW